MKSNIRPFDRISTLKNEFQKGKEKQTKKENKQFKININFPQYFISFPFWMAWWLVAGIIKNNARE